MGDWVFLCIQPYKQTFIKVWSSMKLSPRFFGPYKVLERIGPVGNRLDLLASSKIHPVFNVSYLKKKLGEDKIVQHHLLDIFAASEVQVQSQAILDRRVVMHRRHLVIEVLVQWANLLKEDAT